MIDSLDRTATTITAIAIVATGSAPHDLIGARRKLSQQIHELNQAIDASFVVPLTQQGSPEAFRLRSEYSARNNRARAAIADHQGKWPAVAMRDAVSRYRIDLARLADDQQAYRIWLKSEFVPAATALLRV